MDQLPHFFISRAGADAPFADRIGRILEPRYRVVLQQWDFANRNFMEGMDAALKSGARVIALLSPDYLASDDCMAEWYSVLTGDPLNKAARVIVLRILECEPRGLLRALAYWDLAKVRGQPALVRDIVLAAVTPGRRKDAVDPVAQYWRAARPVVHEAIKPTSSFTGRQPELDKIKAALRSGGAAAVTQPAAVHGLGGIGKSTIAREYGWREREAYAGVWWLAADRPAGAVGWEGVEKGLVELGDQFIRGLAQAQDRPAAARQALEFIAGAGFAKPWLLIYDNVDDRRVLSDWGPRGGAHVLATSRLSGWGGSVAAVEVEEWPLPEAIAYLRAESGRADLGEADAKAVAEALGCLPLALAHAAAYLRARKPVSAQHYIADLTPRMNDAPRDADYPRAVFATFRAAVEQAEAEAPGARAVLSLAAFYAPESIPLELFQQAAEHYPSELAPVAADAGRLREALGALDHLSLVDYDAEKQAFSVHRLVQAAARDALGDASAQWAADAVAAVNAGFPNPEFASWMECERLVEHARAAAALADDALGVPLGRLLNQTGVYLRQRATYVEAAAHLERCSAVFEKALGPDHPDVGTSLNNLAGLYEDQGKYDAAEPLCQRSLAIREKALGPDHPYVGTSLNNLANLYRAQGKYDAAEPLCQRSLTIREKALGPDHPDVANSLNNLAGLYQVQGKYDAAEPLYQHALAIREKALGPDHPEVANSLNNLAGLYQVQGKHDAAEPLYQRGLAIRGKALGPDHPFVGTSLNNLASLYEAQGKYDDAEPLYQRTIAIFERALGPDHPSVGTSLNNLALLYRAQGKYDAAEPLYRRDLAIGEKVLGPHHPDVAITLINLAELLADTGRLDEAEAMARRALEIFRAKLGEAHPNTENARNVLAAIEAARDGGTAIE